MTKHTHSFVVIKFQTWFIVCMSKFTLYIHCAREFVAFIKNSPRFRIQRVPNCYYFKATKLPESKPIISRCEVLHSDFFLLAFHSRWTRNGVPGFRTTAQVSSCWKLLLKTSSFDPFDPWRFLFNQNGIVLHFYFPSVIAISFSHSILRLTLSR